MFTHSKKIEIRFAPWQPTSRNPCGIKAGGDLSEWEHIFMSEFGLEPDYFEDFLFRLA